MGNIKVTIGRNPQCDIQIEDKWDTVSHDHADIEQQNGRLYFTDHSSNGTTVNGKRIHHQSIEIKDNDQILLANSYVLSWGEIRRFFPAHRPTVAINTRTSERKTEPIGGYSGQQVSTSRQTERYNNPNNPITFNHVDERYGQANKYSQAQIDQELSSWSWGGFFCSWLFAACHKVYWPLFIFLIIWVPYAGQVCALCLSVYMGMNGSKIAWSSGKYTDFEHYKRIQSHWMVGGLVWFILSIAAILYSITITLSMF